MAIFALDKLLRSNELNFGLLAVIPTLLLTYVSIGWLWNTIQRRRGLRKKSSLEPLRKSFYELERRLNLLNIGQCPQEECIGFIIFELAHLKKLPEQLSISVDHLQQDIQDLEIAVIHNPSEAIHVLTRMWRMNVLIK